MRGRLSASTNYRLYVSGEFGVREISSLIKLLEAQREVLKIVEDFPDAPS